MQPADPGRMAYLGYEIEAHATFEISPWGWRAVLVVRRAGADRRAVIPTAGRCADEATSKGAALAYGRLLIRERLATGEGPLTGLDG